MSRADLAPPPAMVGCPAFPCSAAFPQDDPGRLKRHLMATHCVRERRADEAVAEARRAALRLANVDVFSVGAAVEECKRVGMYRPERLAAVVEALMDGATLLHCRRLTGASQVTTQRVIVLIESRWPGALPSCGCGKSRYHKGNCTARWAVRRAHEAQRAEAS